MLEQGLRVTPSQRQAFAHALLRAHLGMLKVVAKRGRGDWDAPQETATTVTDLLEAYLKERKLNSKSEAETRAAYRRLVSVIGNKSASDVSKADVRAYRASLFAAPSNRSISADGKLSPTSVKKLLGICATVFRFGVGQGLLESSPFDGGLTRVVRGASQTERRLPYGNADLNTIFHSDAFAKLDAARRWLPLIALYSGARLEEVGGLRVADIREEQGVRFFAFEPTDERRLKNEGSRRFVPVHPELVRLGLLDFAQTLPKSGRLFPDLKPGPHGKLTGAFSKWWGRFTDDLGVDDPRKAFHSLRHCFKDACRTAGLSEELHDALTGHVSGSVGRKYGLGPSLPVLAEAMGRVTFLLVKAT